MGGSGGPGGSRMLEDSPHAASLLAAGDHLPRNFLVQRVLGSAAPGAAAQLGALAQRSSLSRGLEGSVAAMFGGAPAMMAFQQQQLDEIDRREMELAFGGGVGGDGFLHDGMDDGGDDDGHAALEAALYDGGSDLFSGLGSPSPHRGTPTPTSLGVPHAGAPHHPHQPTSHVGRSHTRDSNDSDSCERSMADTQRATSVSSSQSRDGLSPGQAGSSVTSSTFPSARYESRHAKKPPTQRGSRSPLSDGSGEGSSFSDSARELAATHWQRDGAGGKGGDGPGLAASRTDSDRGTSHSSHSGGTTHDADGAESAVSDMDIRDETGAAIDRDSILNALFNI